MKLTYRERDVPERAVGREYPMEDNTREFVATVLSSRPVSPGLVEYDLEIDGEPHEGLLHFVDAD